jgi:hypothetical protein
MQDVRTELRGDLMSLSLLPGSRICALADAIHGDGSSRPAPVARRESGQIGQFTR